MDIPRPLFLVYFPLKFALWFALAELREHDVGFTSDHKNAINVRVWNRKTIFQLEDESSLGLIWEFFINDKRFDLIPYANNWIQACYSICLRILESGYTSTVVFDENDSYNAGYTAGTTARYKR